MCCTTLLYSGITIFVTFVQGICWVLSSVLAALGLLSRSTRVCTGLLPGYLMLLHTSVVLYSRRLDYCNSLLYGMTDSLFQRLQSVQNAAARLITWTGWREHITPVLRELHWLPVRRRVDFKHTFIVHSCTRCCMAGYHGTCRAIVSSSPTRVADYGRPTCPHLTCHRPELVWVIDHLLLPDHRYGTVCRQICT